MYIPYRVQPRARHRCPRPQPPPIRPPSHRSLREEIRAIDPDLPLFQIRTMDENLARAALAVPGVRIDVRLLRVHRADAVGGRPVRGHGLLGHAAHAGDRRPHGARRAVVRRCGGCSSGALVQLAIGLAIGLAGARRRRQAAARRLVRTQPTDLATLGSIAALLVLVALAAGFWPARRATRLDPVVALRNE